jgi:hypothetical protein
MLNVILNSKVAAVTSSMSMAAAGQLAKRVSKASIYV